MGKRAVLVFSFPQPVDTLMTEDILTRALELFKNVNDVKIHMALREEADKVLDIFTKGTL